MARLHPDAPWIGTALVALQFALLAVLGWLALEGLIVGPIPWDAPVLALLAIGLGAWALNANRPGNFNIRPVPRAGGRLVQHGPYRWIRHPMYSALLLGGIAAARFAIDPSSWIALAALCGVLAVKALFEERAMASAHAGYGTYSARTWRFVPWLF